MKNLLAFLKVFWAVFCIGVALFINSALMAIHIPPVFSLFGSTFFYIFILLFGLVMLEFPFNDKSQQNLHQ